MHYTVYVRAINKYWTVRCTVLKIDTFSPRMCYFKPLEVEQDDYIHKVCDVPITILD